MTTPFSDLVSSTTIGAIRDMWYSLAGTVGLSVTSWLPGAVVRSVVSVTAAVIKAATDVNAEAIRGGLLEYARGLWLKEIAKQMYNVDAGTATAATGQFTIVNSGGGQYGPFQPGQLVFLRTSPDKIYRNGAAVLISPLATSTIDIYAEEPGTASNAAPGEIAFQTVLPGVGGTNANPVLGADDESEESIKQRCRLSLGVFSPNGAAFAYEYVGLSTNTDGTIGGEGKQRLNISRVKVHPDSELGVVEVFYASPSGEITTDDLDIVTAATEGSVVPNNTIYAGYSAIAISVDIEYTAYVRSDAGYTIGAIEDAVEDALIELFETAPVEGYAIPGEVTLPVVGKLYRDEISATISQSAPIFRVVLTTPSSDPEAEYGQVFTLGTIIPNVELV